MKSNTMKVIVTGKGGQLAWELEQTLPEGVELYAFSAAELDITNAAMVNDIIISHKPDLVINAAAYTAVDKAEQDQKTAFAVNRDGSEHLALACQHLGAKLIHVSTDFVFDGSKTTPYLVDDTPNPINVYGESKLQGDRKISEILGSQATIIRTAWVYSVNGNNFVKTMLRLMAEKDQLGIVYDQVGTPTWAKGLAQLIWQLATLPENSNQQQTDSATTLHWTDAGVASWFDFAVAIQELALEKGLLQQSIPIKPIPASQYPTPAQRPSFSVIDKSQAETLSKISTVHWRQQLSMMLDELKLC